MSSKVWIDNKFYDKNEARISVFDHGFLFADGIAEGMRAYSGQVHQLHQHLARLVNSARSISLSIPLSQAELVHAIDSTLKANGRLQAYVRVIITRGAGTLGLDPRKCEPSVIVIAEDIMDYPRELYACGLDVITVPEIGSNPLAGTLNRSSAIQAKISALQAGCLDAILFDREKEILGSTDGSVFLVCDHTIRTHSSTDVAHSLVISCSRELGYSVLMEKTPVSELFKTHEIFLASTAAGVIGITRIDGQTIRNGQVGPVTTSIAERYQNILQGIVN